MTQLSQRDSAFSPSRHKFNRFLCNRIVLTRAANNQNQVQHGPKRERQASPFSRYAHQMGLLAKEGNPLWTHPTQQTGLQPAHEHQRCPHTPKNRPPNTVTSQTTKHPRAKPLSVLVQTHSRTTTARSRAPTCSNYAAESSSAACLPVFSSRFWKLSRARWRRSSALAS